MKKIKYLILIFIVVMFISSCGKEVDENKKENGNLYITVHPNNGANDKKILIDDLDNFTIPEYDYEGNDLIGWYFDEDCKEKYDKDLLTYSFDSNDINVDVYAKWMAKRFIVKFMCDGKVVSRQSIDYGKDASPVEPTTKKGYLFLKWDTDYKNIKEDLEINAVYEHVEKTKNVIVILGNWMNNDGTISSTMKKRLDIAIGAIDVINPLMVICSGGMANSKAGISEAQAMYNYLTQNGVNKDILKIEDKSMSTQQNAVNSVKLLENVDFDNLIVISTIEHFVNYSTIKYFDDAILNNSIVKNKNVNLIAYTKAGAY